MGWIKQLFSRRRRYDELSESIREHLDEKVADLIDRGMTREEAEHTARREFGNVTRIEERSREIWQWPTIESIWADIKYSLRQLKRSPGFTFTVILILALGTGANTAIFSVVNTVLLRPLPYKNPGRLVWVAERFTLAFSPGAVLGPDYVAWHRENSTFKQIAAFQTGGPNTSLTAKGESVPVRVTSVTPMIFSMLGVNPILGRSFTTREGTQGRDHVALLSERLWRSQFGASPDILGNTIHLNGSVYTVIGILPGSVRYPQGDVWTPMVLNSAPFLPASRPMAIVNVVGRLKNGVTISQAESNLQLVCHRIDKQYPQRFVASRDRTAQVISLNAFLVRNVRSLLLILLGVVGFVLLIACANVANLLLSRTIERGREFAVRSALGAGRVRLIRQSLTESLVLAVLGSALGFAGGLWFVGFLKKLIPPGIPTAVRFDPAMFGFVVGVVLFATLVFGVVPAQVASCTMSTEALRSGGVRATAGGRTRYLRSFLVMFEIALSLILLIGAGLLTQTFVRLSDVRLGFDLHNILIAQVSRPMTDGFNTPSQVPFFNQVLHRLRALPGVIAAGAVSRPPLSTCAGSNGPIVLRQATENHSLQSVCHTSISPGYFHAIGIPLLAGRFFNADDGNSAPGVVIINRALARVAFGDNDPIGRNVGLYGLKGITWSRVVGVVADATNNTLDQGPSPEVFVPYPQALLPLDATFVVHTSLKPSSLSDEVRKAVQSVDRDQAVSNIQTIDELIRASTEMQRFRMTLIGFFAMLAFVLAILGVFGVMSCSVSQRAQELAVRIALGAQRGNVISLVVGQGMCIAALGLTSGIVGALGLTRFLSSFLYSVKPTDLFTFFAALLLLTGASFIACYIPARHAASIDPMQALRSE